MADVDPITGFLSTYGFAFVGWYETKGTHVDVKDLKYIHGETVVTHPKVACIDIETMCSIGYGMPKPYRRGDRIEMVSIVVKRYLEQGMKKYLVYVGDEIPEEKGVRYIPVEDEVALIHAMVEVIRNESPDIITGYNIFGFDIGYIISRLKLRLLPLPNLSSIPGGTTTTHKVNWSSSAYGTNVYDRVQISGLVFVDLMLFFKRMKLDKYSLDFVSRTFLGKGKMDMTPEEMWMYFRDRDPDGLLRVAGYCIHDSVLTLDLFDKFFIWTDVCEMSSAMRCSIEDIYTRGEQLKVLNQVIYKCSERGMVLVPAGNQSKPEKYEGAYVLEPKRGIFEGCTVVDFQSLYPSILMAYNLCPSTYIHHKYYKQDMVNVVDTGRTIHAFRKRPTGVLPDLVTGLLSQRMSVKAQLSNTTDEMTGVVLDRRQNALKICANSVYGIMGSGNRYMGHTPTAESVSCMGRQLLNSVVTNINSHWDVSIVYGDTDSCFIYHNGSTDESANVETATGIVKAINQTLPSPLKLLVEKYYVKVAFLSKKRYLMYDGSTVKSKGVASSRRNYCLFARELYLNAVQLMFAKSHKRSFNYIMHEISRLIDGKVPLEKLVMTVSVKSIESYTNKNAPQVVMASRLRSHGNNLELGSRLEYVYVEVPNARLQGERMYTPEEVVQMGLQVDYAFYIQKQLATPLDELLDMMGYPKYVHEVYESLSAF
ncbi:DNA-directed DNA polymerase delta [Podila clonocystis]|nr:DNA-directed DNA polymerase delta [Podila clonocystis]